MTRNFQKLIVCPRCKATLLQAESALVCTDGACGSCYKIVDGIPILIHDELGTFRSSAYRPGDRARSTTYSRFRRTIRQWSPKISTNFAAKANFSRLKALLLDAVERPTILIVGGAEAGSGIDDLLNDDRLDIVETDVVIGPRTQMVCDGRFLPFGSESFDAVIIQAVLEYLLTPAECVEEIHRVLKPGAIVYSEMPFLQGVHGGKYDFTRLTLLGHRRLYKCFSEIQSGACAGPATSLAWSIQQLFLSLATSATIRDCIRLGTSMGFFWLKYLDYLLLRAPGALDAATGTYLLARKSAISLSDHELLLQYRGAVPSTGIV